jgi:hypothetical protein
MVTEAELKQAEARMSESRSSVHAVKARFDKRRGRIVVQLSSGLELSFPPKLAQGLENASPEALGTIEISPSGLGLHWPSLDADLYVPALMQGVMGNRSWMARLMGEAGGRSSSSAKAQAARENGKRGGRPRKAA